MKIIVNTDTKFNILKKVIEMFEVKVSQVERSLTDLIDSINNAPGAMQSHSDTTRFQLSRVFEASNKSYIEKKDDLANLKSFLEKGFNSQTETIMIGSIFTLSKQNDKGKNVEENYFMLPTGSGIKIELEGLSFLSVTPISPLGKILIGKKKGEVFLFGVGKFRKKITVKEIF